MKSPSMFFKTSLDEMRGEGQSSYTKVFKIVLSVNLQVFIGGCSFQFVFVLKIYFSGFLFFVNCMIKSIYLPQVA